MLLHEIEVTIEVLYKVEAFELASDPKIKSLTDFETKALDKIHGNMNDQCKSIVMHCLSIAELIVINEDEYVHVLPKLKEMELVESTTLTCICKNTMLSWLSLELLKVHKFLN